MATPSPTVSELLEATDYRDFIRRALNRQGSKGLANFAAFSRKAGFSSRSFARDVVAGKRRITAASLPKFMHGMSLTGDLRIFFETLVALEEPKATPNLARRFSSSQLRERRSKIKGRLQRKPVPMPEASRLFKSYQRWLEVYASLGTPAHGETLGQISLKSSTPEETCRKVLAQMMVDGLVRWDGDSGRYFQTQAQLIIRGMGKSDFVREYFQESLLQVGKWVGSDFDSDERLFLNSVFSMRSGKTHEFKRKLRELLEQFADQAEEAEGDCISRVLVAFGRI